MIIPFTTKTADTYPSPPGTINAWQQPTSQPWGQPQASAPIRTTVQQTHSQELFDEFDEEVQRRVALALAQQEQQKRQQERKGNPPYRTQPLSPEAHIARPNSPFPPAYYGFPDHTHYSHERQRSHSECDIDTLKRQPQNTQDEQETLRIAELSEKSTSVVQKACQEAHTTSKALLEQLEELITTQRIEQEKALQQTQTEATPPSPKLSPLKRALTWSSKTKRRTAELASAAQQERDEQGKQELHFIGYVAKIEKINRSLEALIALLQDEK